MPAKLVPHVVFMPEGWRYIMCIKCANEPHAPCGIAPCPLANAKKAVHSGYVDSLGAHTISTPKGKALSLYAVEMEDIK